MAPLAHFLSKKHDLWVFLGMVFLIFMSKAKTHETVCFPIENVVLGRENASIQAAIFDVFFGIGRKP